jgi:acyl-CoA ligase (AMP-forming) (exosortase A-associated)
MTALPAFSIDHILLRDDESAVALHLRGRIFTYKELNSYVSAMAYLLRTRDCAVGDRVASWAAKGLLTVLMPLAAARAGLVHVPINPQLKGAQAGYILADSGARLCIANKARLDALGRDKPDECTLRDEVDVLAALDSPADALPPSLGDADVDALAALLYTSGSTGRPKGVMLSHKNLSLGAISVAKYLKLNDTDRTLAVLPLSFDYGQNQLFSTWVAGGAVVPLDYLTPRDVVKACSKYEITTLAGVPPLWVQLAELDWPMDAVAPMRRLTNSGGALTEPLVRRLRGLFSKADLYPMYGLTEAFRSTYLPPELVDSHPTSMGRAIPFAEILVVGPDGAECGANVPGELVHCGPLVAKGYWKDPERTAERFKPAPAHSEMGGTAVWSGDTVRRDLGGLLYFDGRDDAMIKVSGNRISPTEIEEVALASGVVAEALAIGQKNDRTGAEIWLILRAAKGTTPDKAAIMDHFKASVPSFMQPAHIVWLDSFPKNPNGKIDRAALVDAIKRGELTP